ncbi:hypothetical protein G5V58_06200 [Nocardioides anomalus]|uniref:PQQ-binding-like beta-propeller repeat protein n=1 Tax=Nocardioides anomalus TaxID=2712223 RepID=A0A6G6WB24_9ACTN|nr:hypothetical protein [Nocardioides anomalus]QIG42416.1 hypothetical protein G5V58_06200 [Nocardioides anomalus]
MRPLPGLRPAALPAALLAALLAALPVVPSAPASAAGREVVLTPTSVGRGPDITSPHVDIDGRTVVDGTVRFPVVAERVVLLGKAGLASYVVATSNDQGGGGRVWRYAADGTGVLLAKAGLERVVLAGDAATLVVSRPERRTGRSTITAYDVATGAVRAQREFGDHAIALSAQDDRVVLGGTRKTRLWTTSTGTVGTLARDPGYFADLASDVVATFTQDPYDGGCSELRRVSSGALVWRSCRQRVFSVSPDGSRLATQDIFIDFPGPPVVDVRTITGTKIARYSVVTYSFGTIAWESPTALLLEVVRDHKGYVARCTGTSCERATEYYDANPSQV